MKTARAATRAASDALHTLQSLRGALPEDPAAWSHQVTSSLAERLPAPLRIVAGPATAVVSTVLPLAARTAEAVLDHLPGLSRSGRLGTRTVPAHSAPAATTSWPDEVPEAAANVGAPGAATATAEQVAERVLPDEMAVPTAESELPVADWDSLALGSLRARTARLSAADLAVLLEWERAHAHRLQVITMLENRLARHADTATAPSTSSRRR